MIVPNFSDTYRGHAGPVEPTIVFQWNRIVIRSKHQPAPTVEVHRELAFEIALQFVTTARKAPHHDQCRSCCQIVEPAPEFLGTVRAVAGPGAPVVVADTV